MNKQITNYNAKRSQKKPELHKIYKAIKKNIAEVFLVNDITN